MVGLIFNVGLTSTPCDAHNAVINVGKPKDPLPLSFLGLISRLANLCISSDNPGYIHRVVLSQD